MRWIETIDETESLDLVSGLVHLLQVDWEKMLRLVYSKKSSTEPEWIGSAINNKNVLFLVEYSQLVHTVLEIVSSSQRKNTKWLIACVANMQIVTHLLCSVSFLFAFPGMIPKQPNHTWIFPLCFHQHIFARENKQKLL